MRTAQGCSRLALLAAPSRTPRHAQIEVVAEWLATMARRADWMSNGARAEDSGKFKDIAKVRAKWVRRLDDPEDGPKEADKLAARKHRLLALFRSGNCYSANVHACTYGLGELVDSLVRLDRVPEQTSAEGLRLLVQAWDEHRRTHKKMACLARRTLATAASYLASLGFWIQERRMCIASHVPLVGCGCACQRLEYHYRQLLNLVRDNTKRCLC